MKETYEYTFSIHDKAIEDPILKTLFAYSFKRICIEFTEDGFNAFRIGCQLRDIELCEIERNIKPVIENIL